MSSRLSDKLFKPDKNTITTVGFRSSHQLVAEKPGFGQGLIFIFILIIVIAICVTIYFVVSGKFNKSASEEKSQITYWT
jgi:hypothetical protein